MNLPGFTAGISVYRTALRYRGAFEGVSRSALAVDLAQRFMPLGPDSIGPSKCRPADLGCMPDPDTPGSCCNLVRTVECEVNCAGPCTCPATCGDCVLPTDEIRQAVLTQQPINPADLLFQQTCQRGSESFTQACEICSQETKISLPWPASDKCIKVCMGGFDPASMTVSARDC